MKPSWGLVLFSLYCAASAASKSTVGHVYTYDSTVKSKDTTQQSPVTPETARLIIAQRLGLSKFHSIENANEEIVAQLNQYGGPAQKLFGQDRESNHAHVLIWFDGVADDQTLIDPSTFAAYSRFTISNPPSPSANAKLIDDFRTQAQFLPKRPDSQLTSYNSNLLIDDILHGGNGHRENHITTVYFNLTNTHGRTPIGKGNSELAPEAFEGFASFLQSIIANLLHAAESSGFSITIVLTPPSAAKSKSKNHPYGTYTFPAHRLQPRRQVPEAILSSSAAAASSAASINNTETTPNLPLAKTGPLLGILKVCYPTQEDCEDATRNCTGHGSCYLSRNGEQKAGGKGKYNDCYSCTCKASVVERGGSKKTTNWGGPACQKKDVVIEFWLFVGATVGLMFLVGTATGMLYSMGEEELPSVIGAGVSGPTRK